jgi:hypothetical protein
MADTDGDHPSGAGKADWCKAYQAVMLFSLFIALEHWKITS